MYKQIIFYGAPGTGKSYAIEEITKEIPKNRIFRVTIHPEYTYTDFVGQLLPKNTENGVVFSFVQGPFTKALAEAYKDTSKEVYLVLEELSRGNVAAIFGDIFQLLDRNKHFESRYTINNSNIAEQIPTIPNDIISLPSNFNILCSVNTNDQNVFPMDTAFKRRFDWEYISTKPATDSQGNVIKALNNPLLKIAISNNREEDISISWQSFYNALNLYITDKEKGLGKNEDKQVGQFFIQFKSELINNSYSDNVQVSEDAQKDINRIIKNKLLLYLWEDVQGKSTYNTQNGLFASNVTSFDDLFSKYGIDRVFSNTLINDFLVPNINTYPYE